MPLAAIALLAAACGGAQSTPTNPGNGGVIDGLQTDATQGSPAAGGNDQAGGGDQVGEVEPEPATPVESDTIRIGSKVWAWSLPMTSGQCFLFSGRHRRAFPRRWRWWATSRPPC